MLSTSPAVFCWIEDKIMREIFKDIKNYNGLLKNCGRKKLSTGKT